MHDELAFTPALELARRIRAKELSPVELVTAYLERIEALDPQINSYITVAADQALAAAADAAEAVGGDELPPLHGIPIGIKDLIDTAGIRTTCATAAWRERVPAVDAAVVAKLRAAGCVILGKHNTPEFAGGTFTEPLAYGACRNPWNLQYSPGGSSGGSGAATAAGLCALALGSDDGGSIRIPSGWGGLVGIKPTRGRVSAAPEPSALYYTPGPMAHTVADAAAMLDAISGYVVGDAFWAPDPARPFLQEVGADPGRLRIAFTTAGADGVPIAPGNAAAVHATAQVLARLGHDVFEVDDWPGRGMFPDDRALGLHAVYGVRFAALTDHGEMPPADTLEPGQQMLTMIGRDVKATDLFYASYLEGKSARQIVAAFFDRWDVLLTPVIASQPTTIGEIQADPAKALGLLQSIQFTGQFSQTGQPAIAVPADVDGDGLPVGVQLVGRPADEATLIRVASQLEVAQPWAGRHPALGGATT
ncbi:MAG TPA: amidase [Acidimicrobiales bacterium]|nr:amidase [Acidimicrobiales bacterium]